MTYDDKAVSVEPDFVIQRFSWKKNAEKNDFVSLLIGCEKYGLALNEFKTCPDISYSALIPLRVE